MQQAAGAGTSDAPPVVDLDSNSVIKARSMGAHVVAPCTHDGLCPMEVGGQGAEVGGGGLEVFASSQCMRGRRKGAKV